MSWRKTIRLSVGTGGETFARVLYDEEDGRPFLELGRKELDGPELWRAYPMTWSTAADLSTALLELMGNKRGGVE